MGIHHEKVRASLMNFAGRFILAPFVCLAVLTGPPASPRGSGHVAGDTPLSATPPQQASSPRRAQAPPVSQEQAVRFERISTGDGLSHPVVGTIVQDQQGFMWFEAGHALNRYDGYGFTVYEHDPADPESLSFLATGALYVDRRGDLWIGTGGGLDRFKPETGTFAHVLRRGQVNYIYEDSAGMLWVGTWRGLYGLDPTTRAESRYYQHDPDADDDRGTLTNDVILAICEDLEGDLWIGTLGGLDRLDRATGTFTHYRHDPADPTSLSSDYIITVFVDSQGVVWVGSRGGLDRFDRSSQTFTHHRFNPEDVEHSLSHDWVLSILEDSAGALWVGTLGGLDRLDPDRDRFVHFRHDPADPHSLSSDAVSSLYEDRTGTLWVGTGNGINKYSRRVNHFVYYWGAPDVTVGDAPPVDVTDISSPSVGFATIYEDREGVLWAGALEGLYRLDRRSGALTVYRHDPADPGSLSDNMVTAIFEDHTGTLWVAAQNGWLEQFDPRTEAFIHYRYLDGSYIYAITEDLSHNLWIGTGPGDELDQGGLYRLDRDREHLTRYLPDPDNPGSLSHGEIFRLFVDPSGALWAATLWGLDYLDDVNTQSAAPFWHYRYDPASPNSLSWYFVLSMYSDPASDDETLWVGTAKGLNRFDLASQTFTHYTEDDGLIDDSVDCIVSDSDGFLWIGTPVGLSRFDPRTETFLNFDRRDGYLISSVETFGGCFRSQTGELFFGGINGAVAFDPRQMEENPHIPPIAITALKLFNQTVRTSVLPGGQIVLSHRDNMVSIEFAALDYTFPEKNQYAYMMEGIDPDWVYAGTRRQADYTNLRPGNYVFRVKGSNNDRVWNEEGIAVHVTVEAPIWDSWFVRGAFAVALAGLALGIYRQRVRDVEARSRELEEQVEERTGELTRTNVRLEQEIAERRRAEDALAQKAVEAAVAAERTRLARDLHDSVTQALYGVTMYAEAAARLLSPETADVGVAAGHLRELRATAQEALREMRLFIFELRPPVLEEEGLVAALRARLETVEGRSGMETELVVVGMDDRLPPEIEAGLYHIAQEALNNALKHAGASRISVSLNRGRRLVLLEVTDDGVGFEASAARERGRLGLAGMEERAAELGARLTVESRLGEGTTIRVEVPQ